MEFFNVKTFCLVYQLWRSSVCSKYIWKWLCDFQIRLLNDVGGCFYSIAKGASSQSCMSQVLQRLKWKLNFCYGRVQKSKKLSNIEIKKDQFCLLITTYTYIVSVCKDQLISKCLFGVILSTKIPTNFFKDFCPSL